MTGRAVIDGMAIHMEDLATAPEQEFPLGREMQKRIGHHTALAVPLMREDRAIGTFALWRMEARPFTEKQIALVKTFADQAAIAIENVRLFNATKEALEQQTAVAEIDRKSTRLNSSHGYISYAVFCLKKKKKHTGRIEKEQVTDIVIGAITVQSIKPELSD